MHGFLLGMGWMDRQREHDADVWIIDGLKNGDGTAGGQQQLLSSLLLLSHPSTPPSEAGLLNNVLC